MANWQWQHFRSKAQKAEHGLRKHQRHGRTSVRPCRAPPPEIVRGQRSPLTEKHSRTPKPWKTSKPFRNGRCESYACPIRRGEGEVWVSVMAAASWTAVDVALWPAVLPCSNATATRRHGVSCAVARRRQLWAGLQGGRARDGRTFSSRRRRGGPIRHPRARYYCTHLVRACVRRARSSWLVASLACA
jgi:hypothetical protein